jgi:CRISPR-associated protein Cmr6
MTRLRSVFKEFSGDLTSMHAELWMDRFLDPGDEVGVAKADHISRLQEISIPDGYAEAIQRRDDELAKLGGTSLVAFDLDFPRKLVPGLGFKGVLEAGLALERTWGTPVIEGSSLKGAARALCGDLDGKEWAVPGTDMESPLGGAWFREVFGTVGGVGRVSFHDAWWIPQPGDTVLPIKGDVLTPHHPAYYGNEEDGIPDGTDNPVPVPFAVLFRPRFRFWLTAPGAELAWPQAARVILCLALRRNGIGAKTDSGYGRLAGEDGVPGTKAPITA